MNKIKGAIFDLDGTLIDSMTQWQKIEVDYINELGVTLSAENINRLNTMSVSQAGEYIKNEFALNLDVEKMAKDIDKRMVQFYTNEVQVKNGVEETLKMLKNNGVKMCVATASDRKIVQIVFERFGFDKYFDFFITCKEIGKGKDCPDIFDFALSKLGTQKCDTYIFEDSYVAVSTAKKHQYNVVGIYDAMSEGNKEKIVSLCDIYAKTENLCDALNEIF